MAENTGQVLEVEKPTVEVTADDNEKKLECAICLQTCIHPVRLPCKHIFCYLCVKGIANQSKKCAICRHEIPPEYLDKPDMVDMTEIESDVVFEDGYQWFYEGRNGWWQYDDRTSMDLEIAFKRGDHRCEVLVAGFLYIVDFQQMFQLRRNDPSRRRRIKRDLANILKKGVAGIRLPSTEHSESDSESNNLVTSSEVGLTGAQLPTAFACQENISSEHLLAMPQNEQFKTSTTTPATPSNTPQTPSMSEENDTSVPSSPGRNSVLDNADHSLVAALYSLQLHDLNSTNGDSSNLGHDAINANRQHTRLQPWDIELNYSEEEEV